MPSVQKTPHSVLVVGASVAGISAVDALRRNGFDGPVTLVDAEPAPFYDRPPLSKQFLAGEWSAERSLLRTADALHAEGIRLVEDRAVSLDPEQREVRIASGRSLRADAIVIATGMRPRRFTGSARSDRVSALRTIGDARHLRERFAAGDSVLVLGNGVLGSEIASTAAASGCRAVLVGSGAGPMSSALGDLASRRLADEHARVGVAAVCGQRVSAVSEVGEAVHVVVDGERISAQHAVLAIGSVPVTDWLRGSGLRLDDGVVCDEFGRADEGIWAAGDVARWFHLDHARTVRWENRTNAFDMGRRVAENVLGARRAYRPLSYFWTDQCGTRIQVHGAMRRADAVDVVEGSLEERFVAVARIGDRPVGVLGWGMPKQARRHSRLIRARPEASGVAPAHSMPQEECR